MTISINSLCVFSSSVKRRHYSRSSWGSDRNSIWAKPSTQKIFFADAPPVLLHGSRSFVKDARHSRILLATNSNKASMDLGATDSRDVEASAALDDQFPSAIVLPDVKGAELSPPSLQEPVPKRPPLTARERLRAARSLSRYTQPKPSKSELGSKVLDALRESNRGKKRSGLPEAPVNLLDDSKRGMPKEGWTFNLPVGSDLFVIIVSFVLISTIMFGTTYVVWKLGAIHFNEY